MLKRILIILAFVVPAGLLIWWLVDRATKVWDKITFTPYVKQVDLQGRSWSDLITSIGSLLGLSEQDLDIVTLGMDIKNDSNLTIPITNFSMKLFYPVEVNDKGDITSFGTEVASTSPDLAKENIIIKKNDTTSVDDRIHLYLNGDAGKLLAQGGLKKNPVIGYKVDSMTVKGIPIPSWVLNKYATGTFKWEY